jgi:AraC family transcriptional regulator
MPQASSIEWVRPGTQRPDTLATPSPLLSSAGMWTGIRLAATEIDHSGELPEGYSHAPLVFVCLDRLVAEACRAGKWTRRRFEPGDFTITPARMPIAYRWYGPNRGILVELELDEFPAPIEIRPSFAGKDPLITHMTLALRDELQAGNPGGRIYGEMLGAALKAHFVRKYAVFGISRSPARADVARNRMAAVLEYISAHLHEPISLMDLAGVANVGVFQFAHAFKRRMGMPPHQYVLRKRVERAISLMRNLEEGIADIALRCGFSSQSHLASAFRRVTGTTPGAYRARFGTRAAPPR